MAVQPAPVSTSDLPLLRPKDFIWLAHFYPVAWLVRWCPAPALEWLEMSSTSFYQALEGAQRALVATRMQRKLGLSGEEAQTLARRFVNYRTLRAQLDLRVLARRPMGRWTNLDVVGKPHLEQALAAGNGVLLVSVHRLAARHATLALHDLGYPLLAVHANRPPQRTRIESRWIAPKHMLTLDCTFPDRVSSHDPDCVLKVYRRLRAGGMVYIAADARDPRSSVPAEFLGDQRGVSRGVLEIARLAGSPVLPYDPTFDDAGLRIEIGAPLQLRTDVGRSDYISTNLPVLVTELERQIKIRPEQWSLWIESG
jgi:lauroyl/myristoyl acyltransferase